MLFVLCLQSGFSSHPATSLLCTYFNPGHTPHSTQPPSFWVVIKIRLWSPSHHSTVMISMVLEVWWVGLNLNQEPGDQPYELVGLGRKTWTVSWNCRLLIESCYKAFRGTLLPPVCHVSAILSLFSECESSAYTKMLPF